MIIQSLVSSGVFNTLGILSGLVLIIFCVYGLMRRKERRKVSHYPVQGWYWTPEEATQFYARKR